MFAKETPDIYSHIRLCILELKQIWHKMSALIPKEVEIQRLKKVYVMVIMLGSIAASVEVDNFVDGSLDQTTIRDRPFTPAHC